MGAIQQFEFNSGPESATLPDPSTPSLDGDLINLSFADSRYARRTVSGSQSSPTSISASGITGITYTTFNIIYVVSDGGAVDVTANPRITAGTAVGQQLIIIGTSDSNTLSLPDGNGLDLNGDCVVDSSQALT